MADIEIDTTLLAWAAMLGLAEYRDDVWQMTDKGAQVLRDYCQRLMDEHDVSAN